MPFRPQPDSYLLSLPEELIQRVVGHYDAPKKDLGVLRLVCNLLNEVVKPRVLESVLLGENVEQLKGLAAGEPSFSELTKTLYLENLKFTDRPYKGHMGVDHGLTDEQAQRLQEARKAQELYICKAISHLKKVKTVRWNPGVQRELNKQILKTIEGLPMLKSVYIKWPDSTSTRNSLPRESDLHLSRPGFSDLTFISLSSIYRECRDQKDVDVVSADINSLLSSCPGVTTIEIYASLYPKEGRTDFADIIKDIPTQPNFTPSIQSLALRDITISHSPTCLRYLANLTSLEVKGFDNVLCTVLNSANIELKTIKITLVTIALVEYLHSYIGLQEISIEEDSPTGKGLEAIDEDLKRAFLLSALPNHRESLAAFQVYSDMVAFGSPLWCLDNMQLACFTSLPKLRTLRVAFLYGANGTGTLISLDHVFDSLFGILGSLETIFFDVVCIFTTSDYAMDSRQGFNSGLCRLLNDISDMPIQPLDTNLLFYLLNRLCPIMTDESQEKSHLDIGDWKGDGAIQAGRHVELACVELFLSISTGSLRATGSP